MPGDYVRVSDDEIDIPTKDRIHAWRPSYSCKRRAAKETARLSRMKAAYLSGPVVVSCSVKAAAASLAFHPFSGLLVAYELYMGDNVWWAGVCIFFLISPVLVTSAVMCCGESRRVAFQNAFGMSACLPGACVVAEIKVTAKELFGCHRSPAEQCFMKLRRIFGMFCGNFPWIIFQVYIFWRQAQIGEHVVKSRSLAMSMILSVYSVYDSFGYFTTYSGLVTGGSKARFFDLLMRLGAGAAPPALLMDLRIRDEVVFNGDLSGVDIQGAESIFRTIKSSQTIRNITFESTNLDRWYDDVGDKEIEWRNCTRLLAQNRHRLRSVKFSPALAIPKQSWCKFHLSALLLEEVRNGDELIYDRSSHYPQTALRDAIELDDSSLCDKEINAPNARSDKFMDWDFAAMMGSWQCLKVLAARTPTYPADETDLIYDACIEGALESVQFLLFCKASPSAHNSGDCRPLGAAAIVGSVEVLRCLVEARADVNKPVDPDISYALHKTPESDSPACAKALLEYGANVNADDKWGWSPLHFCAQYGAFKVCEVLLNAKADVDVEAFKDVRYRPLHIAAKNSSVEITRALLQARATVDKQNAKGETPLAIAKHKSQGDENSFEKQQSINLLMQYGASEK